MSVNILQNVFVGQLVNSAQGPIVTSQVFDEKSMTYLDVYEWEVYNGARLVEPLPFGMFAMIKPMNLNKCKLEVRVAPGYMATPSAPVFQEVCANDASLNPQLLSSVVCRKVVPIASAVESGPGIWESAIEPIDSTHGLRITRHDPVIFQQRSFTLTREIAIPTRFRSGIATQEKTEIVPGNVGLPSMQVGDELRSEQQVNAKTKQVTVRKIDVSTDVVFTGEVAYEEGVKTEVVETLTPTEPTADTGLQIVSSEVSEISPGLFVKETHTAPTWPIFKGSRFDNELNASVGFTEQFVSPPADTTASPNVEYEPVNADRTLKRTLVVPIDTLSNYLISFPVRVNMQLPKVLKSVQVIWNNAKESGDQSSTWSGFSIGQSYSLSCNLSDGASASCAVSPEVIIDIEDIWGSNLPAVGKVFYMKLPITEDQILSRLGASRWPVFKTRSHTIIGLGTKIGVSVRVSVSASSSGSPTNQSKDAGTTSSSSKDVSLSNNVIQIGPTIHGAINFQGELTKAVAAVATATMSVSGSNFPTVTATKTEAISALGGVYPQSFPAVSGQNKIPTGGLYLIDAQVQPYKWGYAKVYAEILNANVFA